MLAVPDQAIESVARRVCADRTPAVLLHCAGALGKDAYGTFQKRGVAFGAFHPLLSFADPRHPPDMRGACIGISGDRHARSMANALARALGARPITAHPGPVPGPAYHAAAALIANGTASLAHVGVDLLVGLGIGRRDAAHGVAALLESVASNVRTMGTPAALTGPIARGDADTVRRHRAVLPKRALHVYDAVAPAILAAARARGLSPAAIRRIQRALRED